MVLPVGLRMFLTFRDILRRHSRIAIFRNLCQMKHTHASGRRWENCFGCHRCVMTWRHGCLFLERSKQNLCTGLSKHWKQSWDSCMLTQVLTRMHACVYRAEMRPSWVRLTMLNWDQSISTLSATLHMRRIVSTTAKVLQGRPQLRLQKSYQFQVPKTNPKLVPCTCLSRSWQSSLSVMLMKEVPFPKPAIEALRGSARPGRGHASDATRIGTRTKRGSRGLETI